MERYTRRQRRLIERQDRLAIGSCLLLAGVLLLLAAWFGWYFG